MKHENSQPESDVCWKFDLYCCHNHPAKWLGPSNGLEPLFNGVIFHFHLPQAVVDCQIAKKLAQWLGLLLDKRNGKSITTVRLILNTYEEMIIHYQVGSVNLECIRTVYVIDWMELYRVINIALKKLRVPFKFALSSGWLYGLGPRVFAWPAYLWHVLHVSKCRCVVGQ